MTAAKGPKGPLTIVSLEAENVMRLRAVRVVPEGNSIVIAGRNAQGKTSLLDTIWLVLDNAAATKAIKRPVRDGESTAYARLDLGDLVATRTWRKDGTSTLKVESADGARYSSPQALLDTLVGKLAFDPLAFAQLPARNQRAALLQLVTLIDLDGEPIDLDDLSARRKQWYDERTVVGRDVTRLAGALAELPPVPPGTPDEPVSQADLIEQYEQARQAEQAKDQARQAALDRADDVMAARSRMARKEQELADLRADLALIERHAKDATLTYERLPAAPDPAPILARMSQVEEVNRSVQLAARRREVAAQHDTAKAEQDQFTTWIGALDETVAAALDRAELPLPGLGITDEGVTYDSIPLAQASSAEKLRVSVAVAMALNPTLRVLRISDGSLLDSENLALIDSMAKDQGFQVWIERVDESGTVGIVIEDGQVKS